MKEAGGIRITEEQELLVLKRRLAIYPQGHPGGRAGRSCAASIRHGSDRRGCRVLGANEFFLKSCGRKYLPNVYTLGWRRSLKRDS
jgi:hypothetical protein